MSVIQTYMTYAFVKLLTTPWDKTEAFKLGLIDKNGTLLKKVADMSEQEKDAYTIWTRLVFNIKRLLEKIPFGRSTLVRYASALWLLKENSSQIADHIALYETMGFEKDDIVTEQYDTVLSEGAYIRIADNKIVYYPASKEAKTIFLGVPLFEFFDGELVSEAELLFIGSNLTNLNETYNELISEDMVTTSAIAGARDGDEPPVVRGKFGKHTWFESDDPDMFTKIRLGKKKHARYDKYVGNGPSGRAIREFGLSNPKEPIILKDKVTGSMLYLRHPT